MKATNYPKFYYENMEDLTRRFEKDLKLLGIDDKTKINVDIIERGCTFIIVLKKIGNKVVSGEK